LALDWDYQQLHVVSAKVSGGRVQVQQAAFWQEEHSPNPAEAEALGRLLRDRLKAAGIAPAPVLACIGRDRVILKDIRYPPVAPAEEPAVVRFQVVKELTDSADDVVMDYAPVTGASGAGEERRALVLIVRRELLVAYQSLCKAAGLKLLALTPRPFGASAGLRASAAGVPSSDSGEPHETRAVLTLAERWTEFCVVRDGCLVLARSFAPGTAPVEEARRNLAVYNGQSPQHAVRAVYLANGGEGEPLRERLEQTLGTPVIPLDPFAGLEGPVPVVRNRGGFAGAVGLLRLQAEGKAVPINFLTPKQPKPPRDPNKKRVALAACLAALLVLGAVAIGYAQIAKRDRELTALTLAKVLLDGQMVQIEEDAKRIEALEEWAGGEIVWLDELYDLTDRFPNTDTIRLTHLTGSPLATAEKEKHVARLTLKGVTTDNFQPVDDLIAQFARDGYPVDPKHVNSNTEHDKQQFSKQFTTRADLQRQPPGKYTRRLPAAIGTGPRGEAPQAPSGGRPPTGRRRGPGGQP
jgi:Tfp pilus assembly PilM family ATPase